MPQMPSSTDEDLIEMMSVCLYIEGLRKVSTIYSTVYFFLL